MPTENLTKSGESLRRPLMALVAGLVLCLASCSIALETGNVRRTQRDGPLVFVLQWEPASIPAGLYLIGKYRAGVQVTLLMKNKAGVCLAETQEAHWLEGMINAYWITRLSLRGDCGRPGDYSVAVLRLPVQEYEPLTLGEVDEKVELAALDKQARSSQILNGLRNKAQDSIPGKLEELDADVTAFRYPIRGLSVAILSYFYLWSPRGDDRYPIGPRAIFIEGMPYPLTGWCSYPILRAFRIDGEYFLESGSCCCGCGLTAQELFKIERSGPVLVQQDWSGSN